MIPGSFQQEAHVMDVSIIIVNYNTAVLTRSCVDSIFKETRDIRFEVIVVDNGSTDGSYALLSEPGYENYQYIFNQDNRGFSRANNQAVEAATGRYLFFLNSDTVLLNNVAGLLLEYMTHHPEAGIAGPQFFNPDMSLQVSCRRFPTIGFGLIKFFPFLKRLLPPWYRAYYMADQDYRSAQPVDTVSAGALMISKELFEEIGRFDEISFMYGEDADLCRRVRDRGKRVVFSPDARLIHYGGQSSRLNSRKAIWSYYMAFYHLYKKYYFKHFAVLIKPLFIARAFVAMGAGLFKKDKRLTWNN